MPVREHNLAPERRRVLIIGASGFLGSAIVREARRQGFWVRAASRRPLPVGDASESVCVDILDRVALKRALEGVDCVIHAAGLAHVAAERPENAAKLVAVNATGTGNVGALAVEAGIQHFVLVSSVSVYGEYEGECCDEVIPCNPRNAYASSKRQGEIEAARVAEAAGMRLTILRMATIYGEEDPGNVARLIRAIDRKQFVWIGSGLNRKTLVYRGDAARACVAALDRAGDETGIFNVATTVSTMREIVEGLAALLGRPLPRLRLPQSMILALTFMASGLPHKSWRVRGLHDVVRKWVVEDVYDGRRFEAAASFRGEVDLGQGLAREVAWYRLAHGLSA
jgi:nucleoside-diphosphate-sugar epimerase